MELLEGVAVPRPIATGPSSRRLGSSDNSRTAAQSLARCARRSSPGAALVHPRAAARLASICCVSIRTLVTACERARRVHGGSRTRLLDDVAERLLHDAVGRHLDGRGHVAIDRIATHLDVDVGCPHRGHEVVECSSVGWCAKGARSSSPRMIPIACRVSASADEASASIRSSPAAAGGGSLDASQTRAGLQGVCSVAGWQTS
jgi:hypothetical protein